MKTSFSVEQLKNIKLADVEGNLRKCVHCGFCQATCPTYVLLGDELDSPRGRIYLIQDMLENNRTPTAKTVQHIDRCLSCLACMTTCPSGVSYRHLIDHARAYIENHYQRPWYDRMLRLMLRHTLPYPKRFRFALAIARPLAHFSGLLAKVPAFNGLASMLALARSKDKPSVMVMPLEAKSMRRKVAIFEGCVQPVLRPDINATTKALLAKFGTESISLAGELCCGSLSHHLGHSEEAEAMALNNLRLWHKSIVNEGVDGLIVTASGCGSTIMDYQALLVNYPEAQPLLSELKDKIFDVSQYLSKLKLPKLPANGFRVAYHSACSLQHGLRITKEPKALLKQAGFTVLEPDEAHLCCGSAGVYNITQPKIADQLLERKVERLEVLAPQAIATGNIGCMTQLAKGTNVPVVPLLSMLAWAYGESKPFAKWPDLYSS